VGLLAIALAAACAPKDQRPGTWIPGEFVTEPVADWSFTAGVPEIHVETRTWYGIPHSVTTVCASSGTALYVPSVYFEGGTFPDGRRWNRNVARDPRVRLGIAGRIHERTAVLVSDPDERASALRAFAEKYPFWQEMLSKPEDERPTLVLLRMDPREEP
jgi:hypothetical protein